MVQVQGTRASSYMETIFRHCVAPLTKTRLKSDGYLSDAVFITNIPS